MADLLMTGVVVAIFALFGGAVIMWRRGEHRRAILMAVAALVIAGNVAVWSVPIPAVGTPATAPNGQAR